MEKNPLDAFLETMRERSEGGEKKVASSLADKVAILQNAFADFSAVSSLKPGDILRGKKVYCENHIKNWDEPHVLLEILPEPVKMTVDPEGSGYCTAAKSYGAIIASLIGDSVVRHLADLREWELYPDAEKHIKRHS